MVRNEGDRRRHGQSARRLDDLLQEPVGIEHAVVVGVGEILEYRAALEEHRHHVELVGLAKALELCRVTQVILPV